MGAGGMWAGARGMWWRDAGRMAIQGVHATCSCNTQHRVCMEGMWWRDAGSMAIQGVHATHRYHTHTHIHTCCLVTTHKNIALCIPVFVHLSMHVCTVGKHFLKIMVHSVFEHDFITNNLWGSGEFHALYCMLVTLDALYCMLVMV